MFQDVVRSIIHKLKKKHLNAILLFQTICQLPFFYMFTFGLLIQWIIKDY